MQLQRREQDLAQAPPLGIGLQSRRRQPVRQEPAEKALRTQRRQGPGQGIAGGEGAEFRLDAQEVALEKAEGASASRGTGLVGQPDGLLGGISTNRLRCRIDRGPTAAEREHAVGHAAHEAGHGGLRLSRGVLQFLRRRDAPAAEYAQDQQLIAIQRRHALFMNR